MVQATDKSATSRCSVYLSGDRQICDLLVHESSVVFMQFLWSVGRVV